MGLLVGSVPQGSAERPMRNVGIVLVKQIEGERQYFSDDSSSSDAISDVDSNSDSSSDASPLPSAADSPIDPSESLPSDPLLGLGTLEQGGIDDAGASTSGGAPNTTINGKVKTNVFGVEGEGTKFVYVFDRSASMSEPNGRPLAMAKTALNDSLNSLDRIHQFQIIFFNHTEPRIFNPTGQEGTARICHGCKPPGSPTICRRHHGRRRDASRSSTGQGGQDATRCDLFFDRWPGSRFCDD